MASVVSVEPTAEQLELIEALEEKAKNAFRELAEVQQSLGVLSETIDLAREFGLYDAAIEDAATASVARLKTLRVSGGRPGLAWWWWYRVARGESLTSAFEACEDLQSIPLHAVDLKIRALDPGLVAALNASASASHINDAEYDRLAGMTRAEVGRRAEAAITQLLDSGWRP